MFFLFSRSAWFSHARFVSAEDGDAQDGWKTSAGRWRNGPTERLRLEHCRQAWGAGMNALRCCCWGGGDGGSGGGGGGAAATAAGIIQYNAM